MRIIMTLMRLFLNFTFSSLFLILCWLQGTAHGQAPPPVKPNPQAPTLAMPAPLGMQRGTALDLKLTGTNQPG
jgi:hypothetical protein